MSHKARKLAGVIAGVAVGVSLLGAGTYASFTSNAAATDKIGVGTFGAAISAYTAPGDTVVLTPANCTLTALNCTGIAVTGPTIQSSAAGSMPVSFTVQSTGSIPGTVALTKDDSGLTSEFSDLETDQASSPLAAQGQSGDNIAYSGGIGWAGGLTNASLGKTETVTYNLVDSSN